MKAIFDSFFGEATSEVEMAAFLKEKFAAEFDEWKAKQIEAKAKTEAEAIQLPFDLDKMCEEARKAVSVYIEREYKCHVKEMQQSHYQRLTGIIGNIVSSSDGDVLTKSDFTGNLTISTEYLEVIMKETDKLYVSKKDLPYRLNIFGYSFAYGKRTQYP